MIRTLLLLLSHIVPCVRVYVQKQVRAIHDVLTCLSVPAILGEAESLVCEDVRECTEWVYLPNFCPHVCRLLLVLMVVVLQIKRVWMCCFLVRPRVRDSSWLVAPGHMVYHRCPRDSPRRSSARLRREMWRGEYVLFVYVTWCDRHVCESHLFAETKALLCILIVIRKTSLFGLRQVVINFASLVFVHDFTKE